MKRNALTLGLFLIILSVSFAVVVYQKHIDNNSEPTAKKEEPMLIGGQKDEHGCLIPAGYSWCEVKQKCLRVWEEACAVESEYDSWLPYSNQTYGFELKLPPDWRGYRAGENTYPDYNLISFSFDKPHQPFTLIQILIYTPSQWKNVINKSALKLLSENSESVYACDGCCGLDENYTGGGQFDEFQVDRCKEGAEIVKTFRLI